MGSFVDEFLEEAQKKLQESEKAFALLRKNKIKEKYLPEYFTFFEFFHLTAVFAGFFRCYQIAEVALFQLNEKQEIQTTFLKYERIKSIIASAQKLKREPLESDEDILGEFEKQEEEVKTFVPQYTESDRAIIAQKSALDSREEELVVLAEALKLQEELFKQKENKIFQKEREQFLTQENISELSGKLQTQESAFEETSKKLFEMTGLYQLNESLLLQKEKQLLALKEEKEQFVEYINQLGTQNEALLSEKTQKEEECVNLQELLEKTTLQNTQNQEDKNEIYRQYEILQEDFVEKKEQLENLINQENDLREQHVDLNTRLVLLQENLSKEKELQQKTERTLEHLKNEMQLLQAELTAIGWPYDAEKIQRELAVLIKEGGQKFAQNSLTSFKELVQKIRMRSFLEIPDFLMQELEKNSQKYQRFYRLFLENNVKSPLDKDLIALLKQIIRCICSNAFRFSKLQEGNILDLSFKAEEQGAFLKISFSDNGAYFDFDTLYAKAMAENFFASDAQVFQKDLLSFLFYEGSLEKSFSSSSLVSVSRVIENIGGKIAVDFNQGLSFQFLLPKQALFDKSLVFSFNDNAFALPVNAILETVLLNKDCSLLRKKEDGSSVFLWREKELSVVNLDSSTPEEVTDFGLVVQAGIYRFFLLVDQVFETQQMLSFAVPESNTVFSELTLFESGQTVNFINLSAFLRYRHISPLQAQAEEGFVEEFSPAEEEKTMSFLIFKSEPSILNAVPAESVLRVEDFSFPPAELLRKRDYETQGKMLALRDSCPREAFPYAQAVLIFENEAIAIQEVVDIIELPASEGETLDNLVYENRKVPLFSMN